MKNMKSMMDKVRKGEGGLTLIELLIVIVILGIIGAVVALNVGGFLGAGTKEAAMLEKDAVQTAVLAAMIDGDCNEVGEGTIGTDGQPNDPAGETICDQTLDNYLQGSIDGGWHVTDSGLIDSGNYSAGGTTCSYGSGNWTCT